MLLLLYADAAFAGSSSVSAVRKTFYNHRADKVRVQISAAGDSIPNITISKSAYFTEGTFLYQIRTFPTTPTAAYDVTITDGAGMELCKAASRSTSAKETYDCSQATGRDQPIHTDLTVAIGNLGTGSTIIEVDFVR